MTEATENQEGIAFEDGEAFTFDMSETQEASGFDPMPKGIYDVVIDEVEYKISKSSNQPMWELKMAISSGEFAEKNRKVFSYLSFKPEQRGRVKQFINRVAPELAGEKNFNPKAIAENGVLVGKPARVKLDIEKSEEYGDRNRVRDILAPLAGGAGGGFSL